MINNSVGETLRNIPAEDFLVAHMDVKPRSAMNPGEQRFYGRHLGSPYRFGTLLHIKAEKAGWKKPFVQAIADGSDRLFLSIANWVRADLNSPQRIETTQWLSTVGFGDLVHPVMEEVNEVIREPQNVNIPTESIEGRIDDYPAFVALGEDIQVSLLQKDIPMILSAVQRAGIALAGLATKRLFEVDMFEAWLALGEPGLSIDEPPAPPRPFD